MLVDKQRRDLRCVPPAIVQNNKEEWNVVTSSNPVNTFHLGEEVYSITDAILC